ncbi:MAG: DEAD/DEAH box helicase family protein, partial [Burkholderiaceae bacterium]|nr:DEAD/DEAH box helicase family protein [Burkholderiaceae bacterium]
MAHLKVAVDTPQHTTLREPLSYLGDPALLPGTLVRVPLGHREVTGIVWTDRAGSGADPVDPAIDLKPLLHALTSLAPLGARWCELIEFAAGYYQRGIGEVALSVLPPELRKLDDAQVRQRIARLHKALAAAPATAAAAEPAGGVASLDAAQTQALAALVEMQRSMKETHPPSAPTVLLHGITGSGKTEIYLRAAAQALAEGRQALVLVPEINLTPQLEARFSERFTGRHIVSMHSGLTPAQRLRSWLAAHLGLADLVLG